MNLVGIAGCAGSGTAFQSGIYEILNTVNGKRYIGSAQRIGVRWAEHRLDLRHGDHNNPHLQRAWNKYGEAAFKFAVLYFCPVDELLRAEQDRLDTLHPEYNVARDARAPMRGLKHTAEALAKISASGKGKIISAEAIAKMSATKRGKKQTPEHIEKVRISLLGNTRKLGKKEGPHTPEHNAKIAAALRGKIKSPEHCANISKSKLLAAKLKREGAWLCSE